MHSMWAWRPEISANLRLKLFRPGYRPRPTILPTHLVPRASNLGEDLPTGNEEGPAISIHEVGKS